MTNLTKNIKKQIIIKLTDIIEIIVFIALMFYGIYLFGYNSSYAFISVIVMVGIYWIADKYIKKGFDKWDVPELNIDEKRKITIIDTLFSVIFAGVIFIFLHMYITFNIWVVLIFVAIILIGEIRRWRRFKKEIKAEVDNLSKEVEENGSEIQRNKLPRERKRR